MDFHRLWLTSMFQENQYVLYTYGMMKLAFLHRITLLPWNKILVPVAIGKKHARVVRVEIYSQFHNVYTTLIFKDSSDPPPPYSILNEKTRSHGKFYRNC